jgi:hypothetical protein
MSILIIILLLLGDGAGDGGALVFVSWAVVGAASPSSSVLVVVVLAILISRRPDGASRMRSRALLALRDLARLVSFVEEEPGPKLDIDVSRFETG